MRARLILLTLIPFLLPAQECCTLGGIVVDSVTREPVRRALVYARSLSGATVQRTLGATATTDASGRFAFSALEPGRYSISAERSGFVTCNYGARRPSRAPVPLQLEPGKDIHDLILPMVPHGVIAGRVVDEEGDPVAGIQVQISTNTYQNGRRQLTRSATATTNDLGEYRAYGLAPGKYYAGAAAGNLFAGMTAQKPPDEDYVPVYYPRTTDPAAAATINVTPGAQIRDIDLRLAKARIVSVRGRVTSTGLLPGATISVAIMPRGTAGSTTRVGAVGNDGTFQVVGVAPGSYYLVASAGIRGKSLSTRVPLTVGGSNLEGVQAAIRGLVVEGRVRVEGTDTPVSPRWQVSLQPFEIGGVMFGMLSGVKLDEGGAFRIEDVGAERYGLWLSGMPDGFYVASIRSGGVDVLAQGLDTSSGVVAPVEIVVRPNAGQITGTVTDGSHQPAAAGTTVVVVPEEQGRREQRNLYKSTPVESDGRFLFKGLIPGEYRIFAFEDIEYSAWLDPEYLKPFESRGEKVTVREGPAQTVQVTLIPVDGQ